MSEARGAGAVARRAIRALRTRVSGRLGEDSFTVEGALEDADRRILEAARPYTMASAERVVAAMDAAAHVVRAGVPGAVVECGVWRGGSVLAMLLSLQRLGADDRDIYLYDTFEGMTAPTDADTSRFDGSALAAWNRARASGRRAWDHFFTPEVFGLEQVRAVLEGTGYPRDRLHFVVGPVEQTLPATVPDAIAVLRLDTDWYESTRHELEHLYPRLQPGGVLIVDDYGHWDGARRAVDEYFDREGGRPLLARTDYTGRLAIKPG